MVAIKPNNLISVSRPMLFWPLNDGELNASATSAASHPASTYSISLPLLQAVGTQWSVDSYWTGSGTEAVQSLWSVHPDEFDDVFSVGNGCGLLWCQFTGAQTGGGGYVFQAGLRGTFVDGIVLRVDTGNWKAQCILGGTGDAAGTGVTSINACLRNPVSPVTIAVLIDHRPDGDNSALIYDNALGGISTSSVSLGDVGPISMANSGTNKVVNIGSLVTSGGSEFSFYTGSVRNFGFINLGDDMPRNIDKIITDLLNNNGRLVQSMDGL